MNSSGASHYKPHTSLGTGAFCLLNDNVLGDANIFCTMHFVQAITLNKLQQSTARTYESV